MTTRKELGDRLADMATRFEQRHVYGILSDLRPEDTQVLRASADALREPFEPDPRGIPCTWCGGEGIDECDDPIQCLEPDCDGDMCRCTACDGRGVDQVVW